MGQKILGKNQKCISNSVHKMAAAILKFTAGPKGISLSLHSPEPHPRQASLGHILSGR